MYQFDFASLWVYTGAIGKGLALTVALTLVGGLVGVAIGIALAWSRTFGPRWLGRVAFAYIEAIRNTPFLVQLFVVYFALPLTGLRLSAWSSALLAMAVNLGAYSAEIVRAGIASTPRGQLEAARCLAMTELQVFRHVVLLPAFARVWPALSSQIVLVMLGSAACSQISVEELTFAANFISSRNFRAFESYFLVTGLYLALAIVLHHGLHKLGDHLFPGRVRRG